MPVSREEFLARRRSGIGGSDVAAIMGLNKYRTPYDVYLDKTGQSEPSEGSEASYWGTVLEDVVAKEYAKRTGNRIQRVNEMLRHPDHEFAVANIDRAIVVPEIAGNVRWKDNRLTTNRILECKTSNAFNTAEWGDEGTDYVPLSYLLQVQWYMGVADVPTADLAVLIGGQQFRTYTIQRDDELFQQLIVSAGTFWRNCQAGIAPDPISVEEAQKKWSKEQVGKSVIVDVSVAEACERLEQITAEQKALKEEQDTLRLKLMQSFEDAEEITHGGEVLATWKTQTANRFDSLSFRKDYPEIAEHYMKETESRVLRLKKGKK